MVEIIAHQPRTFIHGHYRPQNILVNIEATPPRICPVDWEVAALGSPLYDLAFLSDGFAGSMLDQLCAAYQQEALRHGLALPGRAEIQFLVDCFLLHRMFHLLGKAVEEQFSESGVAQLLDRVEMFSNRL
jgi:thiamine kinase-like enzyme